MKRTTELRLIEGTGCPSGRYAVAWGIPHVSNLDDLDGDQLFKAADGKARNYIVEKRTLAIVGTLPIHTRRCRIYDGSVGFYKIGGHHFASLGHSDVMAYWSRAEDWVVVWHDDKWWYNAIYLGHCRATGFHFIEIGDMIEDAVRDYLRTTQHVAYEKAHRADERDPFVDVADLNVIHVAPPMLSIAVEAGVLKENSLLGFRGTVEIRFAATSRGIHAQITRLRVG